MYNYKYYTLINYPTIMYLSISILCISSFILWISLHKFQVFLRISCIIILKGIPSGKALFLFPFIEFYFIDNDSEFIHTYIILCHDLIA